MAYSDCVRNGSVILEMKDGPMSHSRMKTFSDNNIQAFFALVRAGLWVDSEHTASNLQLAGPIVWKDLLRIAREQSVLGLTLAGIDSLPKENRPPKMVLMPGIGEIQILEQRNLAMNHSIRVLIEQLRRADLEALLVKGQGIAQCYNKPLWRSCGDIDLLFDADNYEKAKTLLIPLADKVETEYTRFKHQGLVWGGWSVELHGTMHTRLSKRIDLEIDRIQRDMFRRREFREWHNEEMDVLLPAPYEDVLFIFTHILHHFYIEGIGLRQICDWCRLLWTYRSILNHDMLESQIEKMGLSSEWKAFAALAVNYLGMPSAAIPLWSDDAKWLRKADGIMLFMLETGNFGQNRQVARGKIHSALMKMRDFVRHTQLFPVDSVKFFWHFLWNGIQIAKDSNK